MFILNRAAGHLWEFTSKQMRMARLHPSTSTGTNSASKRGESDWLSSGENCLTGQEETSQNYWQPENCIAEAVAMPPGATVMVPAPPARVLTCTSEGLQSAVELPTAVAFPSMM